MGADFWEFLNLGYCLQVYNTNFKNKDPKKNRQAQFPSLAAFIVRTGYGCTHQQSHKHSATRHGLWRRVAVEQVPTGSALQPGDKHCFILVMPESRLTCQMRMTNPIIVRTFCNFETMAAAQGRRLLNNNNDSDETNAAI